MSSSAEFLANIKEAGQTVISTRRPWRQFLDLSAISLPSSLAEASTRLSHNLTFFLFNYALFALLLFLLSLIYHPLALLFFLLLFAAWYFLYFSSDSDPLTLFNLVSLDDRLIVLILSVLSAVLLLATAVWLNLIVSVAVAALLVALHGAFRNTEDLVGDDLESPYGPMLSDPHNASAGAYTRV